MKRYWWLFVLFPISQFFLIINAYQTVGHLDRRGILGLILAPIADVLVLFLILSSQRKEKVEYELQKVQMLREAEARRNENLERSQKEFLELKESLAAEFERVKESMKNSDDNGESDWKHFEDVLESTRHTFYTENVIVNAILSEKQKQCRQELQTEIDISASLSRHVSFDPMQLCSLFANLLDNAMDAIAELEPEQRYIRLETGYSAGNMWIRVSNPADESHVTRTRRKGHGYGKNILESIAKQHNGVYKSEYKDGIYEASVMVEAEETGAVHDI